MISQKQNRNIFSTFENLCILPSFLSQSECMIILIVINMLIMANAGCPGGSDVKESTCNDGDLVSVPGSGRAPGVFSLHL